MKTPLAELLEKVRPQDWKMDENGNVLNGKEQLRDKVCLLGFSLSMGSNPKAEANNAYVFHAATTLPALVAAARKIANLVPRHGYDAADWRELEAALVAAENVNTKDA